MWALRPHPLHHHDDEGPIDLRKKVVLERDVAEQHCRDDDYSTPRDYSIKDANDRSQKQQDILPVRSLYPFMAERYGANCAVVPVVENYDYSPRDLRNGHGDLRNVQDPRNGHAVSNQHSAGNVKHGEKEQRCKSTDAVFGKDGGLKKTSRSNSCPDLTSIQLEETPTPPAPSPHTNGASPSAIKSHPLHVNGHSPVNVDPPASPSLNGAKKRKSFVPLYGDRAPYEHGCHSPSPQNLTLSEKVYRSPSPKRPSPVYVHHSPSPEFRAYGDRRYRSPSPKRPIYGERHYCSPPQARRALDERRFHSPSPLRPSYQERGYRSPSPPYHQGRGYRSPSPKSPTEPPHYEEYFSHPEVLLRRQLGHQSASPFYLHVYDYYQHLVHRLREQSSPTLRVSSPMSPTPVEEDPSLDAQRKRPCRALTGKHVRQGTGASLSTLLSLRQMIQERQKAKEHQPRPALNGICNKNVPVRRVPPKKAKLNGKSPLSKIQNCS